MKEGESVLSYCARTMENTNKIHFHGEKMDEVSIVENILRSLTSKYNYVVWLIEESKDIDELSLDELQKKKEEVEVEAEKEKEKEEILEVGISAGISKPISINLKVEVETMTNPRETVIDVTNLEAGTLLMAVHDRTKYLTDIWYVNSGCSNHMCGYKFSFSSLNDSLRSTVSFGDCSAVEVMGKGDIRIKTKNSFVETISCVLYFPDLKANLRSAGQLQEKGYIITTKKGKCEIYDPVRGAIAVVQMSSKRLFPLKIDNIKSCLMVETKDSS
ncbi:uncharacterized protein LOC124890276 [Capsicum annuum]|uniref:uncharacterized protein LOC124890276 n=1 Tax=Capsicum annuum TaxID=4072 RepID=UPI001FB19E7D|nr:uncharacterized protein LOC124890276 [Capsicum annuum]